MRSPCSLRVTRRSSIVDRCLQSWAHHSDVADFCVIEGTTGLLDDLGVPSSPESSELLPYTTAQLAKWLGVPIVLVMDGSKVENSIGALVRGYCTWDTATGVDLCGIIFNNVRDPEDLAELEAIVNRACLPQRYVVSISFVIAYDRGRFLDSYTRISVDRSFIPQYPYPWCNPQR